MPRAFDNALRARVITACLEAGVPANKAARRFGVSISTATKWVARARQGGEWTAARRGRPRRSYLDDYEADIVEMIRARPDLTVGDVLHHLRDEHAVPATYACLYAWLRARGWQPGLGLADDAATCEVADADAVASAAGEDDVLVADEAVLDEAALAA